MDITPLEKTAQLLEQLNTLRHRLSKLPNCKAKEEAMKAVDAELNMLEYKLPLATNTQAEAYWSAAEENLLVIDLTCESKRYRVLLRAVKSTTKEYSLDDGQAWKPIAVLRKVKS